MSRPVGVMPPSLVPTLFTAAARRIAEKVKGDPKRAPPRSNGRDEYAGAPRFAVVVGEQVIARFDDEQSAHDHADALAAESFAVVVEEHSDDVRTWRSPNGVDHTIVRGRCATCGRNHYVKQD